MFGFGKKKETGDVPETGWLARLQQGLGKTRAQLGDSLGALFGAGRKLDEAFYEELETVLLTADVGVAATTHLLEALRARARRGRYTEAAQLRDGLREELCALLQAVAQPLDTGSAKPFVIMLAGVNGAGKTTSIGKLAHYFQAQGKSVLLAAGDTFRAAAREQLATWGERNNVTVISQASGDAAAVIFDAINAARARGIAALVEASQGARYDPEHEITVTAGGTEAPSSSPTARPRSWPGCSPGSTPSACRSGSPLTRNRPLPEP